MKQFLTFVRKEFYHILRDRRTMLILLVMPIIQIVLFGFAVTTEVKNVRVAVLDLSHDDATRSITERVKASEYFDIIYNLKSQEEVESLFEKGKIDLILVFSNEFESKLYHTGDAQIQLIADGTDPNRAITLVSYASGIISDYQRDLLVNQNIPIQIVPSVKLLYNPQLKSAYNFVPGVMGLILMLICAMMTSISIVREKEMGTMEVILVSPMRPIFIILSKAVPYLFLSFVNLTTILLLSVFVLDVPVSGSLFLLILLSTIFIIVALSLGILISTIVGTQVAAMLVSGMGLMMPTMVLSGMVFPTESMPVVLQMISHIVPAKWYIAAVKTVMIQGMGISAIWKDLAVLSGMAILLVTVSLKKFKIRLD